MAMYHLSVKYVSRNQGRSAVGAAAYRSATKLYNDHDGLTHDYTGKTGVIHSEILLPDNAPRELLDRQNFWNAVEKAEKRKDARTAREIEIALPLELTPEQQLTLTRDYINNNFVNLGMGADIAIHDGKHGHRKDDRHEEAQHDKSIKKNNPHAHVLLTTRAITPEGLSKKKSPEWDKRQNVVLWREQWADIQNRELERLGFNDRVDHRSYIDRGIDREPTMHEGTTVRQMEKRGIDTRIGRANREITAKNELQNMFNLFNTEYFNNELGQTTVNLPAAYYNNGESINNGNRIINLYSEDLERPPEQVIGKLVHEMCHLYNKQHGIRDTSDNGKYHNQRFKEAAEARGLIAEPDINHGYITKPTPEFTELVQKNCRSDFELSNRNGKQKPKKINQEKKAANIDKAAESREIEIKGELQRMFKMLNERYFDNELEALPINFIIGDTKDITAWHNENDIKMYIKHLNRSPDEVIGGFMQGMCHQYNRKRGVRDINDNSIVKNEHFKKTAEKRGLIVEKHPKFGYITKPNPELSAFIEKNCRFDFKLNNDKIYANHIRRQQEERKRDREAIRQRNQQQRQRAIERENQEQRRIRNLQEAEERKREKERNREFTREIGQSRSF